MPSHNDTDHSRAFGLNILSGRLGTLRKALTTDEVVDALGPCNLFYDPNGANRVVTLPDFVEGGGLFYNVGNVSSSYYLTVKNAAGTTIDTVYPRQTMLFTSSEEEWLTSVGAMGAAGPNNRAGFVESPGPVAAAVRFWREDGQWGSVFVAGVVDAFKFITDGTNIATGTGPDTFKIRSSDTSVGVLVTNNDGTHGDNVDLTVNEAAVDHNSLLNYSANRHIDHTGVTLTAGLGISGGGDISASRSFALDFTELSIVLPDLATDYFTFHDTSGAVPARALLSTLNGILDHNSLLNYSANRHIDHTSVTFTAGIGISGGGDLSANRSFSLDFTELATDDTITATDLIPWYDVSESDHNTSTLAQVNAALDHNSLANYVANQHIDHTSVSIATTAPLSGGGTIATTRTLSISTNGIDDTLLRQGSALSVIGRSANTLGNVANIAGTNNQVLRISGSVLGFGAIDVSTAQITGVLAATSFPALTGDVTTVAGALATTIGANKVTSAMLRTSAGLSVIGRSANTTGNVADITAVTDGHVLRLSGTTLDFGTIATAGIAANAVTLPKIVNATATSRVLGRITAGSGNWEELTAANLKTILALAQADISGLTTADSPQFTAVNIGNASDTTVSRDAAGVIAVEGVPLYPGIPISDKSAAYTTVLADAQKAIRHPAADNNARTFTIDSNANVAYPTGTCITFINEINTVTISITTDTLVLAGTGITGSRTLAANGMAFAVKVAPTRWYISGTGLT